ncbi:MAG: glycosyltransferase [Xanthomonadales bacterium]|nr:glycosyltransferase [Xanthomonadales bacterium]
MKTQSIEFVSVIVPVYNSQDTIADLVSSVVQALDEKYQKLQIVLVNDGSADDSHRVILELLDGPHGSYIKYAQLARNFGEHNAVMCGLRYADGDCAVIIDDDFQNPPEEISKLVDKLDEGHDVVFSYYDKKKHSLFRNLGSRFNDRVATLLLKKPPGLYLSSFKALNRFLIDAVVGYGGPYPYVDGLILRSTRSIGTALCDHQEREKGKSNYTLAKLVSLWLNMSTSFSFTPLRLAAYLGLLTSFVGLILAVFFIVAWSVGGIIAETIPQGWASIIVSVTLFAGIQLLVLGMIGEYLGRLYMTQNQQPQAIVRSVFDGSSRPADD